jgi:hypothetical protein
MIRVTDGLGFEFDLPAGTLAYVDADWTLSAGELDIPALLIDPESARWGEVSTAVPGVGPDLLAARILSAAAHRVADTVVPLAGTAAVCGTGAIARATAGLLGTTALDTAPEPGTGVAVGIDFTGDPDTIQGLLKAIAPLGRAILAGERLGRTLPLNLYPDIHVRGLRLRALDPVALALAGELGMDEDEIPSPGDATDGVRPGPGWFRVGPAN